jgi:hypothetical protein
MRKEKQTSRMKARGKRSLRMYVALPPMNYVPTTLLQSLVCRWLGPCALKPNCCGINEVGKAMRFDKLSRGTG